MVEHSLAIDRFETRLTLIGAREDGAALRQEVARTVSEVLPNAIAAALEPLLGAREGVLRIDRVAITLRLARSELSAFRLANLIAVQIARDVAEHAENAPSGTGAGFAFWPDHASFAASYLALRLGLAPMPEWAFPDFSALEHLAAHEAVLELIAARPAILLALARLITSAGVTAMTAKLPEETAAALVNRLAGAPLGRLSLESATVIARMIEGMASHSPSPLGRATLAAAMVALASSTGPTPTPTAIRTHISLARIAVALVTWRQALQTILGRAPTADELAPGGIALLPAPLRPMIEAVLSPLATSNAGRQKLWRLLQTTRPSAATPPARPTTLPAETAAPMRVIASRLAGIGLLLPSALAHGLHRQLEPMALYLTLVAAAGPEAEAAARLDPLLAALAPFDPRASAPAFPPVSERLRAAVPEALRASEAEDEGARGWAACLAHDFAAGLTGFELSSLPYLRRQFLLRPGRLHLAGDSLTLQLDPMPLGVLLRIAGLHGWIGRLPHGRLRIEIGES